MSDSRYASEHVACSRLTFNAQKERPVVVRVHNNGLGFLINKLNYQGYPKLVSESGVSWLKLVICSLETSFESLQTR